MDFQQRKASRRSAKPGAPGEIASQHLAEIGVGRVYDQPTGAVAFSQGTSDAGTD